MTNWEKDLGLGVSRSVGRSPIPSRGATSNSTNVEKSKRTRTSLIYGRVEERAEGEKRMDVTFEQTEESGG